MNNKLFIFCIFAVFLISFIFAAGIDDELHLNIQVINSSGDVNTGTFNFEFNISTLSDCSSIVYTNKTSLTTDSRGIVSYYLKNVNISVAQQYWLCYYRDNVLINASKISRTPYSFSAKNVSAEGIINDSNMNMVGYNVTGSSGLFSFLGSLVSRISKLFVQDIDFTGNINGSGWINTTANISASYFFGDGSQLTGISTYNATYDAYVDTNFSYFNRSGTNLFLHYPGDNVGIGTSSPTHKLNVVGTMNVTGASLMKDVDFNGGWTNGGVSITNGDIYAQTIWVYNLSSLNVNSLSINGSILPPVGFDNQFDIGSVSLRWNDLYLGGGLFVNDANLGWGNLTGYPSDCAAGDFVIGIGDTLTCVTPSYTTDTNETTRVNLLNQTITDSNSSWLSTYNATYDAYVDTNFSYFNRSGTNLFLHYPGDNVGIGTSSPTHKLNVVGNVNITGNISVGDAFMFTDATGNMVFRI